jgi:carbonic anhydrase
MCRNCIDSPLSRRHLLTGAAALVAAGSLATGRGRAAETDAPVPNDIPPSEAFEQLKQGNARYIAGDPKERDFSVGRVARAEGQAPIVGVLACADSRVPPEIIFDQGPGKVFVVRDAGNVVSTYGLASLEFGVAVLGIPLLLVLGHSSCGAVAAALQSARERKKLPGHLPELVEAIQPAVNEAHGKHPSDLLAATTRENVRLAMQRLKTQSDIIAAAVDSGKVAIKGGVYDLSTGKIEMV